MALLSMSLAFCLDCLLPLAFRTSQKLDRVLLRLLLVLSWQSSICCLVSEIPNFLRVLRCRVFQLLIFLLRALAGVVRFSTNFGLKCRNEFCHHDGV